jgi:uncharacterized repeat protein (TIGR01451 family)
VRAVDDTAAEGAHTGTLSHAISAPVNDTDYPTTLDIADVTVTISDNDTPGVTISESGGSTDVTEGGATDSYTVQLDSQPSSEVLVEVTSDAQSEVRTGAAAFDTLVLSFTASTWDTPQTVDVRAVDDSTVEGSHTSTIDHAISAPVNDADYPTSLSIDSVTVSISDNDSPPASATPTATSAPDTPADTPTSVPDTPTATPTATPTGGPTDDDDDDDTEVPPDTTEPDPTASPTPIMPVPPAGDSDPDAIDLTITLVCAPQVAPGTILSCTISYANTGDAPATDVSIRITIPAGTSFNSAASSPGWQPSGAEPATAYVLTLDSVASGSEGTLQFALNVGAGVAEDTLLRPAARISAANGETTIQDDASSETLVRLFRVYLPIVLGEQAQTTASAQPDLVASFSIEPQQPAYEAGEPVQITAVVTNTGAVTTTVPFWVDFYINPQIEPVVGNMPLPWYDACDPAACWGIAWLVEQPLAPGERVTLTSTPDSFDEEYTRWPGWLPAGTTDLYLYVDSWSPPETGTGGRVAESDESNNQTRLSGLEVTGTNPVVTRRSDLDIPPRAVRP